MCSRPPRRDGGGPVGSGRGHPRWSAVGRCGPVGAAPPAGSAYPAGSGTSDRRVRTINNAPSTSRAVASGRSPRSSAMNRHSGHAVQYAPWTEPHSGQRAPAGTVCSVLGSAASSVLGAFARPSGAAAPSAGFIACSRSATTSSSRAASCASGPTDGASGCSGGGPVTRYRPTARWSGWPATGQGRRRSRSSAGPVRSWHPRWCSAAVPRAVRCGDENRRP